MKKIVVTLIAVILALRALAACGAKTENAAGGEAVGMVNPWSSFETAAAAAESAGVGELALPAANAETPTGGPVGWADFRAMKGLAEADGYVGAAELTVRKGLPEIGEDVSGDYNSYAFTWTQELGGRTVTCSGNENGRTMKAVWQDGGCGYSLTVRGQGDLRGSCGVDAETLAFLVGEIG